MTCAIYNETNPAGFDLEILQIQKYLACLNFMDTLFGVARLQMEVREKSITEDNYLNPQLGKQGAARHERWYPQSRKLDGDVDLSPDDSYISRGFFLVRDPITLSPKEDDWEWTDANAEIKQPFSFLFHCSLDKIANANLNLNIEQIKLGILYSLNQVPRLIVTSMSENISNFWKEFSMTPEMGGFGRYPFYCLRIEAELFYYAFPNNNNKLYYDPSVLYDESKLGNITPNSQTGLANVN